MPAERLSELQRQRALVQEHLAWLDSEIARESGIRGSSSGQAAPMHTSTPSIDLRASTAPTGLTQADDIIARYQKSPESSVNDAKRGCLIAFGITITLFFLICGGAYLFYVYRR